MSSEATVSYVFTIAMILSLPGPAPLPDPEGHDAGQRPARRAGRARSGWQRMRKDSEVRAGSGSMVGRGEERARQPRCSESTRGAAEIRRSARSPRASPSRRAQSIPGRRRRAAPRRAAAGVADTAAGFLFFAMLRRTPHHPGLARALGRLGRGAPKSGAPGWGAGRCKI